MVVVLADDLSGAAELAGAAVRRGLSAEVQDRFSPATAAEVVCIDTDTRSGSSQEAAEICAREAERVAAGRPAWIYKKCDSVLRGHVAQEARAIARASGATEIVVLPANPSRRRVIRGGRYFVEGVPLDQTLFAQDPEFPRLTAEIRRLLGDDLAGIRTFDAESAADVSAVARSLPEHALPVGALDFFEAILTCRLGPATVAGPAAFPAHPERSTGSRLLVCGSAASWESRAQAAAARGIPVAAVPHEIDRILGIVRGRGQALVGIGRAPETHGAPPEALCAILARTAAAVIRAEPVQHLLLEGGATAKAVARALGWSRLSACAVAPAGVGVFVPAGQAHPLIYIKPGSYPWPPEIWPAR